jgi:lactate dehydrogenase-like 2-hydroxyacid dehydrogenase
LKILLTHTPQARAQYYGERSLQGLQAIAQVRLHEANDALDAAGLIDAACDVDIIVADRLTAGPGEIFPKLPNLRAFVRCAVDIRNIDVDAASAAGALVTRAGPGFVQSVAELAIGFMVDLSRGVSRATTDYHAGRKPDVIMGRQLAAAAWVPSGMAASAGTSLISPRYWAWRSWSPIPLPASTTPASGMCRSTICLAIPTLWFASRSPTKRPKT